MELYPMIIGISFDAAAHVQRPQHTKALPQRVAQSIENSNKVSKVPNAIHNARYPFQTQHMCFAIFVKHTKPYSKTDPTESPIQQYQTRWMRSPKNTLALLERHLISKQMTLRKIKKIQILLFLKLSLIYY
jgi:hypothetical protein